MNASARPQLDCLYSGYLAGLHRKSQQSADEVPSVVAAGAWIHVKKLKRGISYYLQDVGVTAYEQARPVTTEFLPRAPVVVARIPADVRHVDRDAIATPNEILGNVSTEFRTVNIPVNGPDWPEGPEPIQNIDRPEVAGVPYLVAFGEMPENGIVQKSVCVGEQPDSHSPAYAPPTFRQIWQAIIG
jgi:hypothetical protein